MDTRAWKVPEGEHPMTQPHPQPQQETLDALEELYKFVDGLDPDFIIRERISIIKARIHKSTHTPAAPATEPKCDDCRFVKECSLLYFPPCEQLARNDERHYREKAKAEREQVLQIFISKAYTRIETVAPMDGIHKGWVLLADVKECLDSLRGGVP